MASSTVTGPLRGIRSGLCLTPGPVGRSARIQPCGSVRWTRTGPGALTYGDLCLAALDGGTGNGTRVGLSTCTGRGSQRWRVGDDGSLVGVGSGRCLDVRDRSRAAGARVQLWDCTGSSNQRWTFG